MGMSFNIVETYISSANRGEVDHDRLTGIKRSCDGADRLFDNNDIESVFVRDAYNGIAVGVIVSDMLIISNRDSGFYDFIKYADKIEFVNERDCNVVVLACFNDLW